MDNCHLSIDRAVHRWVHWGVRSLFNRHCLCQPKKVITTWCGQSPFFVMTSNIVGDTLQRRWDAANGKRGTCIHGSKKNLSWNNQTKSLYLWGIQLCARQLPKTFCSQQILNSHLGICLRAFFMQKNEHTRNLETYCGMQWGVLCLQLGKSQEFKVWQGTDFETIFNWEWLSSGNYYSRKGN